MASVQTTEPIGCLDPASPRMAYGSPLSQAGLCPLRDTLKTPQNDGFSQVYIDFGRIYNTILQNILKLILSNLRKFFDASCPNQTFLCFSADPN